MIEKEIDWEERHFQICLALLSSRPTMQATIVRDADRVIQWLKEHHEKQNSATEANSNGND